MRVLARGMAIDFDGKIVVFDPGDGVFVPAGEKHKHKARMLTHVVKVVLVEDT